MPSINTVAGIKVVNRYKENEDIYIGRGSPLGNPYPITNTDTRDITIVKYKVYLLDQIAKGNSSIINALKEIKNRAQHSQVKLGCFCKPKKCHGDIIKEIVMSTPKQPVVAFTGHRPNKIGGYVVPNPTFTKIYQSMEETIERINPSKIISGMALGVDQWAADIAQNRGIPFIAAVPFLHQESKWPIQSQQLFNTLLELAEEVVIVSPGGYSAHKMQVRNEWMVDHCDILVAVWNGEPYGGTYNCITYAEEHNKTIIRINP